MIDDRYYKYNFNSAEEVKSTKLGKGFQVWGLDKEKLEKSNSTKLLDVVKPLNKWSFVVTLNGQPKTLITIGLENDQYILISGGGDASDFNNSLSKVTSGGKNTKLIKINDVDMLVSEGLQGEIKQSLNKGVSISDDFVTKLKGKQQYNENGELLYGGSNAEGSQVTPTKNLSMIYGSVAVLSIVALAFITWKLRTPARAHVQ
ncbi:hypothetical protein [Paenibacillus sp. Soil522]|uniref:hypothetical protein n=1 Tax=Paenibacillus sp. Soil522 TaxID=1736388 RepID=UPI0006FB1843|nr:hypothetical protein [Paenibacillus sp. Soil522]KRE49912.1 hypothetical protein ASG81_03860 [Paenibacillus sp. Soil522]